MPTLEPHAMELNRLDGRIGELSAMWSRNPTQALELKELLNKRQALARLDAGPGEDHNDPLTRAGMLVVSVQGNGYTNCVELVGKLAQTKVDDPVWSHVFQKVPEADRDLVAAGVALSLGAEGAAKLPLVARHTLLKSLREGLVTDRERAVYRAIEPSIRQVDLQASMADLDNPEYRAALRSKFTAVKPGAATVSIGGKTLPREGGAPVGHEPETELMYEKLFDAPSNKVFGTPTNVAEAMSLQKVTNVFTQQPAKLEGLTLFRPGLANSVPSAASLFRMAQYTDQLVLMGTLTDGSAGSQLRRLTEYRGVPVPPELNLFAIGRVDRAYQPSTTGSDIFIEQLEAIRRDGPGLGLSVSLSPKPGEKPLNVIAHSQGNVEVAMARLRLAEAGYPDVISRHIAMAPAFRGSMLSDDGPGKLFSRSIARSAAGADAVNNLDPDTLWERMPEFLQKTVDVTFHGSSDTAKKARFQLTFSALLIAASKHWVGEGTDGLVDLQSARFVRDPRPQSEGGRLVVSKTAYDHYTVLHDPSSIDELMQHVPPVDPNGTDVLRRVARP